MLQSVGIGDLPEGTEPTEQPVGQFWTPFPAGALVRQENGCAVDKLTVLARSLGMFLAHKNVG